MQIDVGDIVTMKKQHPCGCNIFTVERTGMDIKIKCQKCGHVIMGARSKIEKNIKDIKKP